jgi:hypothetical protein
MKRTIKARWIAAAMTIGVACGSLAFPAFGQGAGDGAGQGMGDGCCRGMGGGMGKGMGMGRGMGKGMGKGMGMRPVIALCAKDIETHCANTPRGPALRNCLETKVKDVSENCRLALESTGPNRGMGTGPVAMLCTKEIDTFCAGIEHVNGQVRDCLTKRKAELGEGCVTALENTGPGCRR